MKVYVRSDIGNVRSVNEDYYYVPQDGEAFCAIADGMGGHNAGEIASQTAVLSFVRQMRLCPHICGRDMEKAIQMANTAVYQLACGNLEYSGMGTTFVAMGQYGGIMHIAHVGDSRAYLIRGSSIHQLTVDHSLVQEMVHRGEITPEEAQVHPRRNVITRAVGPKTEVSVDLKQLNLRPKDVFFLCTDGLSDVVSRERILEIARMDLSWEEKADRTVRDALAADDSSDNITGMFVLPQEDWQ